MARNERHGADDYIVKPFDSKELEARVGAGKRVLELQEQLLSARETLRNEATRDPLTGLPNRMLFGDRLSHSLAQARRRNEMVGVMFLDLDRFKLVNDTLGHSVGDELLKQVAERISLTLREVDTIARMGGDEFTVIVPGLASVDDASKVARRTLRAMSKGFQIDSHELFITASIGISLYPTDGDDAETIVRNADTAMYRAKELGRDNYYIYTESLNSASLERLILESGLRSAVNRNELVLFYQPRLALNSGAIIGAEALVRWQHPELGLIPPGQFIPLAEETGLIGPISDWIIDAACRQNKTWQDAGFHKMDIAVNISPCQFRGDGLVSTVRKVLRNTKLDPERLGLEFTESTLMQNTERAVKTLKELKSLGIKLFIDDFGTGYSSLSYLKKFPVNAVKIDQSFIRDITTNHDDAAIAGAVVAMAHSMGLKVVAEGVESLEQLTFLRSIECDEMQGYFVSRPVPSTEMQQLLFEHRQQTSYMLKAA